MEGEGRVAIRSVVGMVDDLSGFLGAAEDLPCELSGILRVGDNLPLPGSTPGSSSLKLARSAPSSVSKPARAAASRSASFSVRPIIGLADNWLDRPGRSWQADYRLKILLIGHRPIVHMIGRLLT